MTDPLGPLAPALAAHLGAASLEAAVEASATRAVDERWAERLFARDTSLWTEDATIAARISERLGWLDAPLTFAARVPELEAFGDGIRDAGFTAAVVVGMGGGSLAPEVLGRVFGDIPDWLPVRILDSTDPAAVAATVDDLDPLTTLVIVSTKSGTTEEVLAFQADAWERIAAALKAVHAGIPHQPGELMVAITDPGHSLESIPHSGDLREVFLNPADVGGRYAALTNVGLVPASLVGVDLDPLLASATLMRSQCEDPVPTRNPGVALGITLAAAAEAGRDKLTFLIDPELAPFGAWAEQLVAESTGKGGRGIVPVDREPLGAAGTYGTDRFFIRIRLVRGAEETPPDTVAETDRLVEALKTADHPVVDIALDDPIDLGGEFVRWEVATAIAGAILGLNPFDEPNVAESKGNTAAVLEGLRESGAFPPMVWLATGDGLTLAGDASLRLSAGDDTVVGELRRHIHRIRPAGYLAVQAYLAPSSDRDGALSRIRALLRDRTGRPTTTGYGPRYLHSTGQLHKGGPPVGWFLQLTADHAQDREIPGRSYTFGQLIDAQALGDFEALDRRDLPILRVHLGADPDAGLVALERTLATALSEE